MIEYIRHKLVVTRTGIFWRNSRRKGKGSAAQYAQALTLWLVATKELDPKGQRRFKSLKEADAAMRKLLPLLLCLALAGCATANNHPAPTAADNAAARLAADRVTDQQAFAAARTAVLAQLKDPDSAKFGNFTRKKGEANGMFLDIVCGSVNSKNGFGGYAGPEVFLYSVDKKGAPVFDTGIFNGTDIGIKGLATDRCIKNPPA